METLNPCHFTAVRSDRDSEVRVEFQQGRAQGDFRRGKATDIRIVCRVIETVHRRGGMLREQRLRAATAQAVPDPDWQAVTAVAPCIRLATAV